jgi:hypothetical protein
VLLLRLLLFLCLFRFIVIDPLKRALSLLVSVILRSIYMRFYISYWIYYFLILLFLRGILVVVVIITGLSGFLTTSKFKYFYFLFMLIFIFNISFIFERRIILSKIFNLNYLWRFFILFIMMYLLLIFISLALQSNRVLRKI